MYFISLHTIDKTQKPPPPTPIGMQGKSLKMNKYKIHVAAKRKQGISYVFLMWAGAD